MNRQKKTKRWYMHTLEGRPASFLEDQICYEIKNALSLKGVVLLVDSLRKIRRQQRLSRESLVKLGWNIPNIPDYGYVRVVVPEQNV